MNRETVPRLPGYLDMTHPVVYNIKVKRRGDQSDTNLKEIFCCISQLHVSAYKQAIISPTVKKNSKCYYCRVLRKVLRAPTFHIWFNVRIMCNFFILNQAVREVTIRL